MLDGAISATQDLAIRAQLHKLRQLSHSSGSESSNDVSSTRFRVHGWRWHHLGIVRDLARLHKQGTNRKLQMCDVRNPRAQQSRRQFLDALRYIIDDNWALHNFVEGNVMLPWIDRRERNGVTEQRHAIIETERQRLETDSKALANRVDQWVVGRPRTCEREADAILMNVERLRRNAALLFEASEAVLVPQVMRLFSEKEQLKFNSTVLKKITGRQARISLVIFRDAVDQTEPVVAKKADAEDFENSVPGPIRRLAVPYWRSKFVDERIRFITEGDSR